MATNNPTISKINRIKKTVKFVVYALAVAGISFLVWRYDLESIPEGYNHLSPQHMPSGTRVVSMPCGENTPLGEGSVIRYAPPSGGGRATYGVIAGLPGEAITIESNESGNELRVGGRPENISLPKNHKIPTGTIPVDHFLVLLGDRHIRSNAGHPDSRQLGLIKRSWVEAKIISSLYFF